MNKYELIEYLQVSRSAVETNFPKLVASQLRKGILITKTGKGENAVYTVEQVTPDPNATKEQFSTVKRKEKAISQPGEIWIPAFGAPNYEVSNFGRLKNSKDEIIGGTNDRRDGYVLVEISGKKHRMHRLVLQSFDPRPDYLDLTVDHINGIRSDNRLENLRWVEIEENTMAMMQHRAELQRELTRIINKIGYEATLEALKSM